MKNSTAATHNITNKGSSMQSFVARFHFSYLDIKSLTCLMLICCSSQL
jgi:hypothetical protein